MFRIPLLFLLLANPIPADETTAVKDEPAECPQIKLTFELEIQNKTFMLKVRTQQQRDGKLNDEVRTEEILRESTPFAKQLYAAYDQQNDLQAVKKLFHENMNGSLLLVTEGDLFVEETHVKSPRKHLGACVGADCHRIVSRKRKWGFNAPHVMLLTNGLLPMPLLFPLEMISEENSDDAFSHCR